MAGFFSVGAVDPDRRALVDPDEKVTTYGELLATANRYARGLQALGLRQGDTMALMSANRREPLELYAAGVQLGLFVVVVNWHLTTGEVQYILENSGAKVVIAEDRFADIAFTAADTAGIGRDNRFVIGELGDVRPLSALSDGQPDTAPDHRHAGQAMFYTSGTTGKPKGVRKKLGDLSPEDITLACGIGLRTPAVDEPARVQLVAGPLYHAAPLAYAVSALDAGATVVLMDRFEPARFLELVERYGVTTTSLVPTMFHRLLALPDDVRAGADVSSLQSIGHAGAPCPVQVKHEMIDWFGPIVTESYSSTEGAGTTITSAEWLARPGSVGRPSPGVVLKILDDDGNEVPVGEAGLVYVTQAYWEFEYLGDPEKTSSSRRDGMFTVGDIGYVDDEGYLFLCDRQAEVIISGGVNIYPAEVESVLLAHPSVGDATVIGVPSDEWGEEVRAVVEVKAGLTADDALGAALVAHCRAHIAHYKCPKQVDFVTELGRDPNGKVRKGAMREQYWKGRDRRI